MAFEWDEAKRERNIAKHGIDFIFALALFDGRFVITAQSPRGGEDRYATTGRIDGRFTAIWTWRGGTVRVISARRARREEEQRYGALLGTTD